MKMIGRLAATLVLGVLVGACATATRAPLTDVPPGTYVLVEPTGGPYNAAAINERAFSVRVGDRTFTGQHWVDAQGRIHMAEDTGPCANQESIWTYTQTGNRVTLNLVEDRCRVRDPAFPQRMVYERR